MKVNSFIVSDVILPKEYEEMMKIRWRTSVYWGN